MQDTLASDPAIAAGMRDETAMMDPSDTYRRLQEGSRKRRRSPLAIAAPAVIAVAMIGGGALYFIAKPNGSSIPTITPAIPAASTEVAPQPSAPAAADAARAENNVAQDQADRAQADQAKAQKAATNVAKVAPAAPVLKVRTAPVTHHAARRAAEPTRSARAATDSSADVSATVATPSSPDTAARPAMTNTAPAPAQAAPAAPIGHAAGAGLGAPDGPTDRAGPGHHPGAHAVDRDPAATVRPG